MMKCYLSVLLLLSFALQAQKEHDGINETGIQFEEISWAEILQKAKRENKFIFADCYASWCVPCKKMEKEVFVLENVGMYINKHFISVRVQMDTSKVDNEGVRKRYKDAAAIKRQHKIYAFPTYLFFSPEGKIVHRYLNALPDSLFLKVAGNALRPEKQYYTLLARYTKGKKDYTKLNYLASISKEIGEDSLANVIAKDYLSNYLNKLSAKELFHKRPLILSINSFQ